jgi:hypothetical protein
MLVWVGQEVQEVPRRIVPEHQHQAASSQANVPVAAISARLGEVRDQLKLLADYL